MMYMDPERVTRVDVVSGACMLVRRSALDQVGLLDEEFFLYADDVDWCYRFVQKGWVNYYDPRAVVVHYKHATVIRLGWRPAIEFWKSNYIFYRKHFLKSTPRPLNWAIMPVFLLRAAIGIVERRTRAYRHRA